MDTRQLEGNIGAAFAIHVLRGIGQVVFQNNPVSGLIILGALFFNS